MDGKVTEVHSHNSTAITCPSWLLTSVPDPEPNLRLCKVVYKLLDLLPEPRDRLWYGFPWTPLDIRQFLQQLCEVKTISALWTTFLGLWVIHKTKKNQQGPRHTESHSWYVYPVPHSLLATALSCQGMQYRIAVGTIALGYRGWLGGTKRTQPWTYWIWNVPGVSCASSACTLGVAFQETEWAAWCVGGAV